MPPKSPPIDEKSTQESDGATIPESHTGDEDGQVSRKVTGARWFIVNLAVLSATFLYALDNTVMANVRPSIIETFGNRVDTLAWLSISYPMGEVGANPLWYELSKFSPRFGCAISLTAYLNRAKLYGQVNNKLLYLSALLIFEVGSVVIASAQSIEGLLIGRAVAGLGGSGIYVGTLNILTAMTIPAERNQYLNFVGIAWSLGTILGPVVGGAFADSSATWRWAFYLNICIAGLTTPACIWLVPSILPSSSEKLWNRIRRIDFLGSLLFLGGATTIVMVLGFGGAIYDWKSKQMIGLYVGTVVAWALFSLQQSFNILTVDRIFPIHFIGDWLMVGLFAWTSISIANIVVTIYSLPLFFQFTFGDSSLKSAVYTLPFVFTAVAGGGVSGPLLPRFPVYMAWFIGASSLMLIGNGLLSTIDSTSSRGAICGYTVIQGLGVGPVIQLGYTIGQLKVAKSAIPEVTAFLSCAQMAGLTLSLGISTSVFLEGATGDISDILPGTSRSLIQSTINGVKTGLIRDLTVDVRQRVLDAIALNVGKMFYLNLAGSAMGFAIALFMRRERVNIVA
ncbi:hypothetical protein HYFRA_00010692 [Hymenoscyphus fraxineus]|uniref:Major facilitator superfamily (MFS) profile domain-containing protein n=1 Tax=Hymenoscyphus fraxineus TaxID=746836 RepID=A0A9N9L3X2_9HELO|nr:hypothetical protein HYFRA_00010692 [Hymenoscyphus fraxineus]